MTQDVQWIRKALIQRREYDALLKEIETLRIELLAADYEAEHAFGWFTAKKKQALIEKRDILQARLSPLEKNLQGLSPASLRSLADQSQLLNNKHPSATTERLVEILNFATRACLDIITRLLIFDKNVRNRLWRPTLENDFAERTGHTLKIRKEKGESASGVFL